MRSIRPRPGQSFPTSLSLRPIRARTIHTTRILPHQHVLYLGNVLGYTSDDRLSKFPRAWLDSVGVSSDVDHGLRWTDASGSPGHALLSYTLLDAPLDPSLRMPRVSTEELATSSSSGQNAKENRQTGKEAEGGEEEGTVLEDEAGEKATSAQPCKVFALGRNTHAQLGLGFSSQEATRGMVTGVMEGKGGVQMISVGNGSSHVVTSTSASPVKDGTGQSNVYGFGNDTLGQLGASSPNTSTHSSSSSSGGDPYDVSTRQKGSDAPQLRLLPLPKKISISEGEEIDHDAGWRVVDISSGLDHSLMLLERTVNNYRIQQVVSTGLNTDGQLGLTPSSKADAVPMLPLLSRTFQPVPGLPDTPIGEGDTSTGLKGVICGADTSYALTAKGDLWVWGNSEYGQSFAGIHDRIPSPVFVANPLPAAYTSNGISFESHSPPRIHKLVAGGSFAAILDNQGRVWVIGYGPRASSSSSQPSSTPEEWAQLSLVTGFPPNPETMVKNLFCGLEYLLAVTRSTSSENNKVEIWIWGIPPRSISTVPIPNPTPVPFTLPKTPRQKWLDENPRLKKDMEKEGEKVQDSGQKRKVSVIAAACTRDYILVIVDDAKGKDVWAECVAPPKGKGTDVTI
ncbi:uncharacterized protein UTRI_04649 [Ustilago trichophora]|uniref:Uncharacterized protein n=1 Tax=Ustilago trichophora TaxID=86804 RepID=A0A5C3EH26_9BASI|nr:uncharacterized protein UTRI_04649 [Ustilago trichophora]